MLAEEIIIKPIVTEKSNDGLQEGKYTFKVNPKATKVEIAQAVEKLQIHKKAHILQKVEKKKKLLKNIKTL